MNKSWRFATEIDGQPLEWKIGSGIVPNNNGTDPEGNPLWQIQVIEIIEGENPPSGM